MSKNEVQGNEEEGYYIDPVWLSDRLRSYAADCKAAKEADEDKPVMPEDIAKSVMMMVENMARRPNFSGYKVGGWLYDMKLDAIETAVKYLDRYDESKTNVKNPAFAYLNRIIWQAFVRRIEKEKKHTAIKNKLYDTQLNNDMFQHLDSHDIDDPKFHSEHDPMDRHE